MRPLTEDESKAVFTKLANYIVRLFRLLWRSVLTSLDQGKNLIHLIDRADEPYCFRLQKDRVYYVSESSMRLGISVARPNLVSLGTCFGKFSKSGKFKLHITALDYVAQYAKYKVCLFLLCTRSSKNMTAGVDQAQWRDALPLRQPRRESTPGEDNGRYTRTSGSCCLQHERHSIGMPMIWGCCTHIFITFYRVSVSLLDLQSIHENLTRQPSLYSIKRMFLLNLRVLRSSRVVYSDVGEYLRDEVRSDILLLVISD